MTDRTENEMPPLNTVETVGRLLRTQLARCVSRRASALEGDANARRAQFFDTEELRELADLLQGKGDDAARYLVQPWNSVDQMGRWIKTAYKMECPQDEAVFVFRLNVLCQVYEMVDRTDGGASPDKPHAGIARLIAMSVYALLGIPWKE